jgi:hypothetical protein
MKIDKPEISESRSVVGYSRMKTMISATRIKKTETAEVELYYKAGSWKTSDPEF